MESSNAKKPDPEHLQTLVMARLQAPVVFHGMIQDWPAGKWTPEYLASVLGDKEVKIRIGLKEANQWVSTQWEANCTYETTMLSNLCDWMKQDTRSSHPLDNPENNPQDIHQDRGLQAEKNPLLQYDPDKYWCYMDYKYMAELLQDHQDMLQAIRWSDFGFRDRDGQQSTIWIGSQGATTPGHYDTYGCNLVAQIYGRKKWHLFPPNQSDALYQTRIPYEESSVFSPINISRPDLKKYPQFSTATPYVVTLDPGDVLFVPHHWWHFVEIIETSVSVNTWIEMDADHQERFHEAITRALVSEVLPVLPSSAENCGKNSKWLNPTEELCDTTTNMKYLKCTLLNLVQHQNNEQDDKNQEVPSIHTTDIKTSPESDNIPQDWLKRSQGDNIVADSKDTTKEPKSSCSPIKRQKCSSEIQSFSDKNQLPEFVSPVPCLGQMCTVQNDLRHSENSTSQQHNQVENESGDMLELLLQSVTHPEVISLVGRLMRDKIQEKK